MGRVEGKVAIVTGGAMGLGAAQARLLAEEGATVIVTDIAEAEGRATVEALARPGLFIAHDVSSEEGWAKVEAQVSERYGRLDILVNNAAILIVGSIEELSFADWRRLQAVNADGAFLGCRMAVRMMKASGGNGSIVNIASVASHVGEPYAAGYCGSKGAVRALTKSVAIHCMEAGYKIRCNSVHPGSMDTPMVRKLRQARGLADADPAWGDPRQLAYAVLYLASDESALVTGTELLVDNGRTAAPPAPGAWPPAAYLGG
jgi:3(or 17)beta-hydroxysteroid dehydrogenase